MHATDTLSFIQSVMSGPAGKVSGAEPHSQLAVLPHRRTIRIAQQCGCQHGMLVVPKFEYRIGGVFPKHATVRTGRQPKIEHTFGNRSGRTVVPQVICIIEFRDARGEHVRVVEFTRIAQP